MSRTDGPGRHDGEVGVGPAEPAGHPRIEVVRGGRLSVEQTAALAVAVTAHTAAEPSSAASDDGHAWARAARLEGTGRPRIDRPSDLGQLDR